VVYDSAANIAEEVEMGLTSGRLSGDDSADVAAYSSASRGVSPKVKRMLPDWL